MEMSDDAGQRERDAATLYDAVTLPAYALDYDFAMSAPHFYQRVLCR